MFHRATYDEPDDQYLKRGLREAQRGVRLFEFLLKVVPLLKELHEVNKHKLNEKVFEWANTDINLCKQEIRDFVYQRWHASEVPVELIRLLTV